MRTHSKLDNHQGTRMKPERLTAAIGLTLLTMMTGCLKTPSTEYVTNKEGQATLIADHSAADPGIPLAKQCNAPERATAEIEGLNEYTSIQVDAEVLLPEGTAIPIYRFTHAELDSQKMEQYVNAIFGEEGFHQYPFDVDYTPDEMRDWIEFYEHILATAEVTDTDQQVISDDGEVLEINAEEQQMYQRNLNQLLQDMETLDLPEYGDPVSYEFETKEEPIYYEQNKIPYSYERVGFTGRRNGKTYHLFAFQSNKNTEVDLCMDSSEEVLDGYALRDLNISAQYRNGVVEMSKCKYSVEEAVELCEDFLADLDIESMEPVQIADLDVSGHEWDGTNRNTEYLDRRGYQIVFAPTYDGMAEDPSGVTNLNMGHIGNESPVFHRMADIAYNKDGKEDFVENTYTPPVICFWVLDSGIVRVKMMNLLEQQEQLAENVKLLDFNQALSQGVAQLDVLYNQAGTSLNRINLKVQAIQLNYATMRSPSQENEYILVPVWDFKSGKSGTTLVTINAIDGTYFNREQGY